MTNTDSGAEYWRQDARNERIGALLTFVIGAGLAAAAGAETGDVSMANRLFAIPLAVTAWEAIKFGIGELRTANQIEQDHNL